MTTIIEIHHITPTIFSAEVQSKKSDDPMDTTEDGKESSLLGRQIEADLVKDEFVKNTPADVKASDTDNNINVEVKSESAEVKKEVKCEVNDSIATEIKVEAKSEQVSTFLSPAPPSIGIFVALVLQKASA